MKSSEEKNLDLFQKDGVVLLKDCLPKDLITKVSSEYFNLDKNLQNREIYKDRPLIVFWRHVVGEQKRICGFEDFPALWEIMTDAIIPKLRRIFKGKIDKIQLLETIIFNKPYENSNILHWHQDVAYFPLKPNNQIAIWFPLESVTKLSGALHYALGSHKEGAKGSTDLHTRKKYDNEDRDLIPKDPAKAGYTVKCMEMNNTDMVIHDGYTWHYSPPNKQKNYTRIGFSIRFITHDATYDPRPGQAAAFTKQIDFKKGELFQGKPFPVL